MELTKLTMEQEAEIRERVKHRYCGRTPEVAHVQDDLESLLSALTDVREERDSSDLAFENANDVIGKLEADLRAAESRAAIAEAKLDSISYIFGTVNEKP